MEEKGFLEWLEDDAGDKGAWSEFSVTRASRYTAHTIIHCHGVPALIA